ncbi:MAG: lipid II:glycine glycyltransferase FemX [Thermacetogeniaceae bacterium]
MIEVVLGTQEAGWRDFLADQPKAGIFHTPEWANFIYQTFHYKPYYLFARDSSRRITGFLPLFQIKSRLTGNRLCSLPFAYQCSILGDPTSQRILLDKAVELVEELNAAYLEVRDSINNSSFHSSSCYSTYILELSNNPDHVWRKFKSNVRRNINKSRKYRVMVEETKDMEALKVFYQLNCINKKSLGSPCHPWIFYKNLFHHLKDHASLYVASYNNKIIAGGVMLTYGDYFIYGYGAADPAYLHYRPYNALLWKSIEDACLKGYRYFDFGRVSVSDSGLIHFKSRWGSVEKKLPYSYYPQMPRSQIMNRKGFIYQLETELLQAMPRPIYKRLSNLVFGHIG